MDIEVVKRYKEEKNTPPIGVTMPWYVVVINLLLSIGVFLELLVCFAPFILILDVMSDSKSVAPRVISFILFIGCVLLFFSWWIEMVIRIWYGEFRTVCKTRYLSVLAFVLLCLSVFIGDWYISSRMMAILFFSLLPLVHMLLVYALEELPESAKWLAFREKWLIYKAKHPTARLRDIEYENQFHKEPQTRNISDSTDAATMMSSDKTCWLMRPALAWPFFVLGLGFIVLSYISFHKHGYYGEVVGWNDWTTIIYLVCGVVLILIALVSFGRKSR